MRKKKGVVRERRRERERERREKCEVEFCWKSFVGRFTFT